MKILKLVWLFACALQTHYLRPELTHALERVLNRFYPFLLSMKTNVIIPNAGTACNSPAGLDSKRTCASTVGSSAGWSPPSWWTQVDENLSLILGAEKYLFTQKTGARDWEHALGSLKHFRPHSSRFISKPPHPHTLTHSVRHQLCLSISFFSPEMPFVYLGTLMPFRKAEYQLSSPAGPLPTPELPPSCIFNRHTRAADKWFLFLTGEGRLRLHRDGECRRERGAPDWVHGEDYAHMH